MLDSGPEGWKRTSLGDIISLEYGRALPEASRLKGDVPVYGSNGPVGFHAEHVVGERGIVVGRKGTAGSIHVTEGAFWPIDTAYFVRQRRAVDFDWLASTLRHADLGSLNEATGIPGLNRDNAYRQQILLPPIDEQRRIAGVLSSADNLIAAQEAVVEKLRDVQSATFASFLRSGDAADPSAKISGWITGRIEGVERLPLGWKITRLVDVAKLESGHTPSRKEPTYWDGGDIGWISLHDTQNLDRPEIISSEMMITQEGLSNSSARLLPAGTVCFSRTATVGKCVIMGRSMATSQDFANFICSEEISNRYLLYLLRWMQPVWKQLASGSTHKTIYMPTFESLQIVLPPRSAQDEISAAMDCMTDAIESGLTTLEQYCKSRTALVDQLLSGRVRVPA